MNVLTVVPSNATPEQIAQAKAATIHLTEFQLRIVLRGLAEKVAPSVPEQYASEAAKDLDADIENAMAAAAKYSAGGVV